MKSRLGPFTSRSYSQRQTLLGPKTFLSLPPFISLLHVLSEVCQSTAAMAIFSPNRTFAQDAFPAV